MGPAFCGRGYGFWGLDHVEAFRGGGATFFSIVCLLFNVLAILYIYPHVLSLPQFLAIIYPAFVSTICGTIRALGWWMGG